MLKACIVLRSYHDTVLLQATTAAKPAKVPKVSSSDADVPTLAKDGKVSKTLTLFTPHLM